MRLIISANRSFSTAIKVSSTRVKSSFDALPVTRQRAMGRFELFEEYSGQISGLDA
jgi:hypothetical protein